MNELISKYKLIIVFIALLVLDGLFFGLIDPNNVSQIFLLFGFVLAGLTVYLLIFLIIRYLKFLGFKFKNESRISLVLTIVLIISLALESIGQFSSIDLITLVVFCLILYVYLSVISSNRRSK